MKWILKRAARTISKTRTRWKEELCIDYDELTLRYATRSPTAKRWFYPRYISGKRVHEPPISSLIRSELLDGSTFYDVGANVGFFTVLGANLCTASDGEVHAFELDPALIPLIEESLRLNENRGRAYLNCVACTDEVGSFHRFQPEQRDNPSTNRLKPDEDIEEGEAYVQASTTTLDHYWRRTGAAPDLIKMDIEGAEALAVFGMLEVVEEVAPKLILEVHPEAVRQFGEQPMSLVKQLREVGRYETIARIESYRSDQDEQLRELTSLDTDLFEEDHPVVLFFASDLIDSDFCA